MRTGTWKAAAVALTLVVAGCGGDDDDGATDEVEGTEDVGGSDAGATDDTAADDSGDDAAGGGGGEAEVTIANFAFSPDEITVAEGGTVTVTNEDSASHTFTSEDGNFDLPLDGSASGSVTLTVGPGSYDFLCTIHPSMTGTLTVE